MRFMPSLKAAGLAMYPAYREDEIAIHAPCLLSPPHPPPPPPPSTSTRFAMAQSTTTTTTTTTRGQYLASILAVMRAPGQDPAATLTCARTMLETLMHSIEQQP